MLSYWETDLFQQSFDCIVLGGGFNGLNVAMRFKQERPKARVLLVDDGMGRRGASTKNAGFACYGSPSEVLSDIELMGEAAAIDLLDQRKSGIEMLAKYCRGTGIHEHSPAYEVFLPENQELFEKCKEQLPYLNQRIERQIGLANAYQLLEQTAVSGALGSIAMQGEGQVHPARLHQKLWQDARQIGVEFYTAKAEHVEKEHGGMRLLLDNCLELKTEWLVNCINGFDNTLNQGSEVLPARAQVLITSELDQMPYQGNYHMDEGYYYFRNVGKRLLLGGARNLDPKTEETHEIALNQGIQERLKQVLSEMLLPNVSYTIERQWAGIMGMRKDKSPGIKQDGNYLDLVGMSGMGVALSFYLPAKLVAQVV